MTTPWSSFPIYTPVPSDPHTPSGAGLDDTTWTVPDAPAALPWNTAPVPTLPTSVPRPYWRFDRSLDLRKNAEFHLRNQLTVREPAPVQNRPSSSRPRSRPSRQAPPAAPAAPAPAVPALTVAPVQLTGVPGSSHRGINTVSVVINKILRLTLL